jgi:class 3 adenylate cyclase
MKARPTPAAYDADVPALPSGTVTFAFTDIEGSTGLLKQLGERYRDVLAQHRRIVRTAFEGANGIEIDTQGDAFFFSFPRARDAVGAAVQVQREHASTDWPDGSVVRVRIGLHTGEPAVDEEGYLGLDVVRAARICSTAAGGQVLLSESTRALLGSGLPDGVSVFPVGERHLKNIDEPERIYELGIAGVELEPVEEPAPPATPATPQDRGRFDDLGARYAARVREAVLRSLGGEGDDANLERLADRAELLQDEIAKRVEESLRARGISPDQPTR